MRSGGANSKPSGKISTAPTFKSPFFPFPKTCLICLSYGILTTASKTVSGNTA